jgi:hypothetical protein
MGVCVPYLQGHIVWHTSLPHASSLPEVCCMMGRSSDLGTRQQAFVVQQNFQPLSVKTEGRGGPASRICAFCVLHSSGWLTLLGAAHSRCQHLQQHYLLDAARSRCQHLQQHYLLGAAHSRCQEPPRHERVGPYTALEEGSLATTERVVARTWQHSTAQHIASELSRVLSQHLVPAIRVCHSFVPFVCVMRIGSVLCVHMDMRADVHFVINKLKCGLALSPEYYNTALPP